MVQDSVIGVERPEESDKLARPCLGSGVHSVFPGLSDREGMSLHQECVPMMDKPRGTENRG